MQKVEHSCESWYSWILTWNTATTESKWINGIYHIYQTQGRICKISYLRKFSYFTEASQTKQVTSQWLQSSCMWINVSQRLVLHSSLYLFQKNKTAKMKTSYKNVLGNSLTMKYVSSSQIPVIRRLLITRHF